MCTYKTAMNVLFEVVGVLAKRSQFCCLHGYAKVLLLCAFEQKLLKSVMDYSAVQHYILGLLALAG